MHLMMRLDEIDAMVEAVMPVSRIPNKVLVANVLTHRDRAEARTLFDGIW